MADVKKKKQPPNPGALPKSQKRHPEQDFIFEALSGITKPELYEQSRMGEVYPELLWALQGGRGITVDLPAHAEATRRITERHGFMPGLFAGAMQEGAGGLQALLAGEPLISSTAISPADLLANMYGASEGSDILSTLFGLGGVEDQDFINMIQALAEAGY